MPELLLPIFVFYLVYLYFSTKLPKANGKDDGFQKPVAQPVKAVNIAETKLQTAKPTPKASETPKVKTAKPTPQSSTSAPEARLKTEAHVERTLKKPRTSVTKSVLENSGLSVPERVGLTAGDLWHYLDKNGPSPVANLLRELLEEEKIIQRSIGWLAQEGKITIEKNGQVEIVALILK